MTITVHSTLALTAGIADIRPIGVSAPAAVRPSGTRRARTALTRRHSTGPALRHRPQAVAQDAGTTVPAVTSGDTVVVAVVRPPRHGAGGGPRARPATTLR